MGNFDRQHRTVRLLVSNLSEGECTLSLEPLGGQVTLPKGEAFTVELSGPGKGLVEVIYATNELIIGEWDGATTVVMNRHGEIIRQS
jgi:hypothetical protein